MRSEKKDKKAEKTERFGKEKTNSRDWNGHVGVQAAGESFTVEFD